MGVISSLEFIPSDYKIKYAESHQKQDMKLHKGQSALLGTKSLRVLLMKGRMEIVKVPNQDSTIGWLLKEVREIYDHLYEEGKLGDGPKQTIVGLKSTESISSLDYYLSKMNNSLHPVKESTILVVHYAKNTDKDKEDGSKPKINKDSFHYLKVIGSGGYSHVVLARKKDNGKLYAIKIIKKDKTYMKTNKNVYLTEANIMRKLTGLPFNVGLHYTFQTPNELYFVMDPWIGGNLFHFMTHFSKKDLNLNIVKFYLSEILVALDMIHAQNIMYRDLKPENILIDIDGHIKISDFGLSKQLKRRDETSLTFCGSPEYIPPEMILGYEHSKSVDFYTLGCLLYEMIVGFPPFHSRDIKKLEKRIVSGSICFPPEVDDVTKDLIEWLLSRYPLDRPTECSEIKNHEFFDGIDWDRISKKEAIPPWVPDLYTFHGSKGISLKQVFTKNSKFKGEKRTSQNARKGSAGDLEQNFDLEGHQSGHQPRNKSMKMIPTDSQDELYLEDFDWEVEPKEDEIFFGNDFLDSLGHNDESSNEIHPNNTSESYTGIEELGASPSPQKSGQEGKINSLQKYNGDIASKKRSSKLRKFGSVEYAVTPKAEQHWYFYKKTFEDFNAATNFSKSFKEKKPSMDSSDLEKL